MARGKFIVFEGPNGCGKGEQITRFQHYLRSQGKAVPVFITGEPNETFDPIWGTKAREMLKKDGDPYKNQLESLKYFSENRRVHNKIFRPLLDLGAHVISDRYYHSTFAFQGAQGIPYERIAEVNRSEGIKIPDITFLLDVPVDVVVQRRNKRKEVLRKFEQDSSFDELVRKNYLELSDILPSLLDDKSVVVIDGSSSPEEVFQKVRDAYEDRFVITKVL
jgi:dTMP kinase